MIKCQFLSFADQVYLSQILANVSKVVRICLMSCTEKTKFIVKIGSVPNMPGVALNVEITFLLIWGYCEYCHNRSFNNKVYLFQSNDCLFYEILISRQDEIS